MSRQLRELMPGALFHITARTQGCASWFKPLREQIEYCIVEGVDTSDAMLVGRAVMDNHFHIVLRQGAKPLGWVMQPIMRRIALMVQRRYEFTGHVFGHKYASFLCWNADYARRGVVYTHLNPVRKKFLESPDQFGWDNEMRLLIESDVGVSAIELVHVLRLFGHNGNETDAELHSNYVNYVRWRLSKDWHIAQKIPFGIPEPDTASGDRYFLENFRGGPGPSMVYRKDLRDKAIEILSQIDPHLEIGVLRRRNLPRALVAIRKQLIAALLQRGYRCCDIADFFKISDTRVSAVATAMRYDRHPPETGNGKGVRLM
jgi:putative transposase